MVSNFKVSLCLIFQTRAGTKPLIWKYDLFAKSFSCKLNTCLRWIKRKYYSFKIENKSFSRKEFLLKGEPRADAIRVTKWQAAS